MSFSIILHKPRNDRFTRYCDFCGATEGEATILIASPNGHHICDDCVDVCVEALARASAKKGKSAAVDDAP
jgi:ATP-dependent protease Clp ATPase subunit